MSYRIDVQNEFEYGIDAERLIHAAEQTLTIQSAAPGCSLTIVLTDDETVRGLNQQFRGIDTPTDVLSFPADAPPVPYSDDPAGLAPYLGDLIIAYPYSRAQALREDHAVADSLSLLVVHGTLHLLGYDHDTPQSRAIMWGQQAEVLAALGISAAIVPALENAEHDDE